MDRRKFLGINVGAVALSPFALLPMSGAGQLGVEVDLLPFCWHGSSYDLDLPFARDGWVYATDGRVLVRVKQVVGQLADATARLPSLAQLRFAGADAEWQPWPEQAWIVDPRTERRPDYGRYDTCPYCDGHGRIGPDVIACPHCDDQCHQCLPTGYVGGERCEYCGGRGCTTRPCIQRVGETLVGGNYDLRLRRLPGLQWVAWDMRPDIAPQGEPGLAIRFAGGEGLVCPIVR